MRHKEAFTLVELSIVILVISIILSTALYFKEVQQKAVVHRILQERHKIVANLKLFEARFGQLPGNINEVECSQNAVLRETKLENTTQFLCSSATGISITSSNGSVVSTNGVGGTASPCGMCDTMVGSGKRDSNIYAMRMVAILSADLSIKDLKSAYIDSGYISYGDVQNYYIRSVISENAYWTFAPNNEFRGLRNEILTTDTVVSRVFLNKSHISLFYNAPSICGDNYGAGCQSAFGVVSPVVAYYIDYKVDDGMPYTGYVVSWKLGYVQNNSSLSVIDLKKYCNTLDKQLTNSNLINITDNDIRNAKYATNTKFEERDEYGCNLSFAIAR
jgi:prepilin-type N-terminal cleavage/methylation domain-containing protein